MSTLFPDFQPWGQMGKMASFLLLVITPLIQPALSDLETQELIDEICQQCEDYGFCYRTFNENLKTPTTDAQGLVQITTVQSLYHATNTYILVKKLIANTSDATVRGHLRICDNGYNAVLNLFQEAFRSFNLKDYRSMMAYEWDTQRAVAASDAIFSVAFLSRPVNRQEQENEDAHYNGSSKWFCLYRLMCINWSLFLCYIVHSQADEGYIE